MWKNFQFSIKMSILASVFILFSLITGIGYHLMANNVRDIGIKSSSDAMLDGYKGGLKDVIDMMAQSLSSATENVNNEKEVHAIFTTLIKDARFFPDKSGYIFIYKEGGTSFVHPVKPQLEGKDLSKLADANGKLLIQELDTASKKGGGFVEYLWDKPGKGNLPKLSYAKMIPGKRYWLGTGVYIDDVEEKELNIFNEISDYSNKYLKILYAILAGILILLILPLSWLMVKSIVEPLVSLTTISREYSLGKLDKEFTETERQDEIGALARSVKRLGRSTKIVMEKFEEQKNAKLS